MAPILSILWILSILSDLFQITRAERSASIRAAS
jgi:hypothetical protein